MGILSHVDTRPGVLSKPGLDGSLSVSVSLSVSLSHIHTPVLQEDTFKLQHLFYLERQEDPQGLDRKH